MAVHQLYHNVFVVQMFLKIASNNHYLPWAKHLSIQLTVKSVFPSYWYLLVPTSYYELHLNLGRRFARSGGSLSPPPGSLLATDRSKAVDLV